MEVILLLMYPSRVFVMVCWSRKQLASDECSPGVTITRTTVSYLSSGLQLFSGFRLVFNTIQHVCEILHHQCIVNMTVPRALLTKYPWKIPTNTTLGTGKKYGDSGVGMVIAQDTVWNDISPQTVMTLHITFRRNPSTYLADIVMCRPSWVVALRLIVREHRLLCSNIYIPGRESFLVLDWLCRDLLFARFLNYEAGRL